MQDRIFIRILFIILALFISQQAEAKEVNYSWIDVNATVLDPAHPANNVYEIGFDCPVPNPAQWPTPGGYNQNNAQSTWPSNLMWVNPNFYWKTGNTTTPDYCGDASSPGYGDYQYFSEGERWWYKPRPSHASYALSCYYQGLSYVNDNPNTMMPVQPLTNNIDVLKSLVADSRGQVTSTTGRLSSGKVGRVVTAHGLAIKDTEEIRNGGGTSAMQGLLWSWRVLSPNWKDVWGQQSYYEANIPGSLPDDTTTWRQRDINDPDPLQKVPADSALKHIIVISDGEDTDGPERFNSLIRTTTINGQPVEILRSGQDSIMSTCDAHNPIQSISTDTDGSTYERVCTAMARKGIKVHVILYGYPNNHDLENCATTTGGKIATANTSNIEEELDKIVGGLRGLTGVRLVESY